MRTRYKFLVFCFVGGVAALIDLLFFNLFFSVIQAGFILSRILGIGISMIWNFTMNRNVTFSAKNSKVKNQLMKYFIMYGITMSANVLVGIVVLNIIGDNLFGGNIAAIAGIAISVPLNFIGSLLWTFKNSKA
ncbi:GtrA family protein [Candidatus Pacearchaeota archaeon]|nr:GtrA family protein [Candidatus Pacearchaeota archaeon]